MKSINRFIITICLLASLGLSHNAIASSAANPPPIEATDDMTEEEIAAARARDFPLFKGIIEALKAPEYGPLQSALQTFIQGAGFEALDLLRHSMGGEYVAAVQASTELSGKITTALFSELRDMHEIEIEKHGILALRTALKNIIIKTPHAILHTAIAPSMGNLMWIINAYILRTTYEVTNRSATKF